MASMTQNLKQRLPEILLEIFSVVLAVLVALGVNQWQEDKENAELAELARTKIEAEVRSNIDEVEGAGTKIQGLLAELRGTIKEVETGAEGEIGLSFPVAVLSSSAWDTSKATQALNYMDFEWVMRVGRVYDLQKIHHQSQTEVLNFISSMDHSEASQPARMLRGFLGRAETALELQQGLLEDYRDLLTNP
ncbi:MAG: hypothetical protein K0U98_02125 [Deltaproteobacteria bacterium]|nr:hypothetical protein [Deltaproteobacteria bacterium]